VRRQCREQAAVNGREGFVSSAQATWDDRASGRAAERRLGSGPIESVGVCFCCNSGDPTPRRRKIAGLLIAIDSSLTAKRIFCMAG